MTSTAGADVQRGQVHALGTGGADRPREEMAPDVLFTEEFTWRAGQIDVSLDFWADEAVQIIGSATSRR
jgi:hypothetical protein